MHRRPLGGTFVVTETPDADAPVVEPLSDPSQTALSNVVGDDAGQTSSKLNTDRPEPNTPDTTLSERSTPTATPEESGSALKIDATPERVPTLMLRGEPLKYETKSNDQGVTEQMWSDGTLHWGQRAGDEWVEKWQTQEGEQVRFGTKRGQDTKADREWQERWEQRDGILRVEKRVTQHARRGADMADDLEDDERWVERLEMSENEIVTSRVGEDRRHGRAWRTFERFRVVDGRRQLVLSDSEQKWSDGDTVREVTMLQPGDRVLRTETKFLRAGEQWEEVRYEDPVTGSRWGTKKGGARKADDAAKGDETWEEEWSHNVRTGAYSNKKRTVDPKTHSSRGNVESYDPGSGESYREEWGHELRGTEHREWSAKWRKRDEGLAWGDYSDRVQEYDPTGGDVVLREVVKGEKWSDQQNGETHREKWTHVTTYNNEVPVQIEKWGHNDFGSEATEDWFELYDGSEKLLEHRIEKNNPARHTVESRSHRDAAGKAAGWVEHHRVFDKTINQVDEWHVNEMGERWGEKGGCNSEGVSWRENWGQYRHEEWLEKAWKKETPAESREWGELWGSRGSQQWRESWGREAGRMWRERNETDADGNSIVKKEGEEWQDGRLVDSYSDHYGVTTTGETWAYKTGFNETHGNWLEKWNESKERKTACKRGDNPAGDSWLEEWRETYDSDGQRTHVWAHKEGANARGEDWLEEWTEGPDFKHAVKSGRRDQDTWREEWGEEPDSTKWCRKWAANGNDHWGQAWGSQQDKSWGQEWHGDSVTQQW